MTAICNACRARYPAKDIHSCPPRTQYRVEFLTIEDEARGWPMSSLCDLDLTTDEIMKFLYENRDDIVKARVTLIRTSYEDKSDRFNDLLKIKKRRINEKEGST